MAEQSVDATHERARTVAVAGGARRAVGTLLAGEAVNKAARFAAAIVLARSLTLEEFGLVNVGIALSGVLAIVASLGLSDYGARIAATDAGRLPALITPILVARLSALALLVVAGAGIAMVISAGSLELVVLAAAMSLGVVVSLDWLLRGQSRMREVALATGVGGLLLVVLCLTAVRGFPSVPVALAAFIAAELAAAGITWVAVRVRPTALRRADAIRPVVVGAWPLAVSAVVVYAYSANLDTILLSGLKSPAEAGLYSAPYRIFLAATSVVVFAGYAYLPRLAVTLGTPAERDVMKSLRNALMALSGYGIVLTGMTELAGASILGMLFGSEFRAMEPTFILLMVALPWYGIGFPSGYTLIARGLERRFMLGAGLAGALNLTLNLALIPPLGTEGAAIATAAALVGATIVWLRAHALLASLSRVLALAGCVTSGAAVVAAVEGAAPLIGLPTVVVGVVVLWRSAVPPLIH